MSDELESWPELIVIRDELSQLFVPDQATGVLLSALRRYGDVPADRIQFEEFCRSALALTVAERLSVEAAEHLIQRLDDILSRFSNLPPAPSEPPPEAFDDVTTIGSRPPPRGPIKVVLLSRSGAHAALLLAAMGSEQLQVEHGGSTRHLRALVALMRPHFVLVDAVQPPDTSADEVARAVEQIRSDPTVLVYGQETQFGETLQRALQRDALFLLESEGMEPVCDLIRVRAGGRRQAQA